MTDTSFEGSAQTPAVNQYPARIYFSRDFTSEINALFDPRYSEDDQPQVLWVRTDELPDALGLAVEEAMGWPPLYVECGHNEVKTVKKVLQEKGFWPSVTSVGRVAIDKIPYVPPETNFNLMHVAVLTPSQLARVYARGIRNQR